MFAEGSHPLIHASYQQSSLPEAEVEEEVVESKAVLTSDGYEVNEPLQRDRAKRDSPYLMFEITSDDGFSVQTETCEGSVWSLLQHSLRLSLLQHSLVVMCFFF